MLTGGDAEPGRVDIPISPRVKRLRNDRRPARLRAARFQDYQQIALLEARHGLGTLAEKSYERWMHLWKGNPAYRERQSDWTIGWVLEAENGRIVGSMTNVPLLYEFQGKRVLAASGRSWAV